MPIHWFKGRKLVIATMHGKESVMAPLLQEALGVECIVPNLINTDLLGTFSGEIERKKSPYETAKDKCLLALRQTNTDLAVANEGSFGAHPSMPFVSGDDEIVLLLDTKNQLEIFAREVNTHTNFSGKEVTTVEELLEFAASVHFPSHALILRPSQNNHHSIFKGLQVREELLEKFQILMAEYGSCFAETDMRAHFNPTRMKVIEAATRKLIEKLQSACPKCGAPGFDVTSVNPGLPCELCGSPTRSSLSWIYTCQACGFTLEKFFPKGKETESATFCDICNP
jgi:predicted RNA-binding Zn-ribbon protein involved in translation (DUF1610 family)